MPGVPAESSEVPSTLGLCVFPVIPAKSPLSCRAPSGNPPVAKAPAFGNNGHFMAFSQKQDPQRRYAWYRDLSRYHWFVLVVASLGWMFDTMAQQLFNLARVPAIRDLLGARPGDPDMAGLVSEQAGYATMIFMIGWAAGGVIFGILGDRIGRAKTMIMTILLYSGFTGLSVFSTGIWDFQHLPLPLRARRGRAVRRGGGAGGRDHAGPRPALCARAWCRRSRRSATWWPRSPVSSSARWSRRALSWAPGATCSWPARCPRPSRCWSSRS